MEYLPAVPVAIPFIFALLIILYSRAHEAVYKTLAVLGSAATIIVVLLMSGLMLTGGKIGGGLAGLSFPLSFAFAADGLSVFFALIFAFCFLMAVVYSPGYLEHSHAKSRYLALMLIFEGSMIGVVLSGSLIGLLIFFEIMTVSAYLLVIHEEDETAMFAGAKFLYMSLAAGLAIFFGLAITYYLGGRVDFVPGGYIQDSPLAIYALFAFLLGFGVKAGMFPVHIWLPDAHPAAPAPVSALLSGCSIKTGIYGIIRVMHDIYGLEVVRAASFDKVLLVLAIITILLGSALALQQDQLKRRLAYSSVAQIGYVLLGLSLLSERALFGALFHVFSHALMKGCLFLCAGAIIAQTGKKYISQMTGIGYKMPVVMVCFTLASLTMVGIPPFNAFISKWNLAVASLEAGQILLVAVLVVSSLLNALYYFPIVINAFYVDEKEQIERKLLFDKVPASMLWTTAFMAVLCIGFVFMRPNWSVVVIKSIAATIF
jgi:multicomponent Na+:H+ antiporter subunit D